MTHLAIKRKYMKIERMRRLQKGIFSLTVINRDETMKRILERDNYKCVYCNSVSYLAIDYVISMPNISFYGLSVDEAYKDSNLVSCCRPCDKIKGTMSLEEFFMERPDYKENFIKNAAHINQKILTTIELLSNK